MHEEIILGIDPGTQVTGYGLIRVTPASMTTLDFGCIRPPKKGTPAEKYLTIFEGVSSLIQLHQPHAISVETQFVFKNIQTALKLGMARGAVLIAAAKAKLSIYEYAPSKAKKAIVGNGNASKHQVQKMIQMLLSLSELPTPDDAADALALAICHAQTIKGAKRCMLT